MYITRILATLAIATSALSANAAGDAMSGKNKIYQCQGCHGIADWKSAFPEVYRVPKLGGQKPEYIVAALKGYRSGERDFPTMRAMVAGMSDQDFQDIAAYYGSQPATVAEKK